MNDPEVELAHVLKAIEARKGRQFDLKSFCHDKQLEFVQDPAPYATAVTSRRAGKTVGCAADLISTALTYENSTSLYITLSRVNAKILFWPILKEINEKLKLNGEPNESDLSMKFTNKSIIYLSGVKDQSEIEKFRGLAIRKAYLDEAQSMKAFIEQLIDDILDPACIDHDGQIRVIGTPAPVPVGYFHKINHDPKLGAWSRHFWTIWDNPHIKDPNKRLRLALERRGITVDDPSIQREFFGKWALDLNSLVIRYDAAINHYDSLPDVEWDHILGVDIGFEDSDAIAVIAFSDKHKAAFLVRELIRDKQGITELAAQLEELIKEFRPIKIKMDTGGLGKKIAEEIRRRYGIPVEAAEKDRKFEFIEITNDALRTGRFMAKADSRFAQDAMLLEWDRENPQKPKVSDRFHSDIIDAVLYGLRESLHWTYEPEAPAIKLGTIEHFNQQEKEIIEHVERSHRERKAEDDWWRDPFDQ